MMQSKQPYMGPALFHVGYVKTATSYLQAAIFSNPEFGMKLSGGDENRSYIMQWFKTDDQYLFDPVAISEKMDLLEKPIRELGLVPVWSEETLLGNPMKRQYDGARVLDQLRSLNRPFKVFITIRRQPDLCLSAYREYLKINRHSLRDFIGTGHEPRSYRPILDPEFLRFDVAVGRWMDAFGPENILVLPHEFLKSNPDGYVRRLADFVGVSQSPAPPAQAHNVGQGGVALVAARFLNAFFVRSPLSSRMSISQRVVKKLQRIINRLTPRKFDDLVESRWKREIANRYEGLFEGSNRNLETLTNQDLRKFGYSMAPLKKTGTDIVSEP